MKLLYRYSRQYWGLVALALLLAATNQIFSLLDPVIFRHVIDGYATKYHQFTQGQFIRGAGLLLLAAVGVAFVSRVAKNFQDYYVNVIVQRLGARIYSDGIRHSLELPYQVFEDQRSGETLGKLQKVRSDVEKFITAAINVIFISLIGITEKILQLELKKVKYVRVLRFIQGTSVNALRTGIMFLMLYLIFRQQITIGQFFSLMIYSFYIFTPLQELGNVINIYRETEVSLQNFQEILDTPRDPKP